jgi:tetratricopeptide (TPR) repeat protein
MKVFRLNIKHITSVLLIIIAMSGCGKSKSGSAQDVAEKISLAAQLSAKGLHEEAASEYISLLENSRLEKNKKSNICYLIGNLFYDNLKNYKKALAWYIRAKHYDPKNPTMQKITERMVNCLEKTGRSLDAQNVLSKATYLAGKDTRTFSGKVVARMGDRDILMGELDNEIQKLPSEQQKKYRDDKNAKLQFLRQYVQNDLLYQMATRAGLDKNPEFRTRVMDFEKMMLVQQVYREKVSGKVKVNPEDIQRYFKAHIEEFRKSEKNEDGAEKEIPDEDLLKKNAQLIMRKLHAEKSREHEARLLDQMMKSQNVLIFEGEFVD